MLLFSCLGDEAAGRYDIDRMGAVTLVSLMVNFICEGWWRSFFVEGYDWMIGNMRPSVALCCLLIGHSFVRIRSKFSISDDFRQLCTARYFHDYNLPKVLLLCSCTGHRPALPELTTLQPHHHPLVRTTNVAFPRHRTAPRQVPSRYICYLNACLPSALACPKPNQFTF